ncbi:MAG: NifU family protein [Acidimicrobiia bacterium]
MSDPVLTVTDAARTKIVEVRASEAQPDSLALFVEVSGQQDGAYTYTMELRPLAEAGDSDVVQNHDDLPVVVEAESADALRGATLDFAAAGMVMQNPNLPPAPSVEPPWTVDADTELSSDVARTVIAVLEEQINPQIAAHGGRADLIAVEETVAYLVLSGGCQGCGMAAVTLSQGIEVAILDAIPEIEKVVDVTDHASGVNPYFEAAKK